MTEALIAWTARLSQQLSTEALLSADIISPEHAYA